MNRAMKRILSFAFVLILVAGMATPAFAAGKIKALEGKITVGMLNPYTPGDPNYAAVIIATGDKKFSISPSKIKLSRGTAGAVLDYFFTGSIYGSSGNGSYTSKVEYKSGNKWKTSTTSAKGYSFTVILRVDKPGTCKLTYYIGKTKHVVDLTISEKYQNPVKTMTLTGVNGGKSFPVKKDQGHGTLSLNADVKSAKLKIVPAKNWKLMSMNIYDQTTSVQKGLSVSSNGPMMMPTTGGMSSGVINWGKLIKGHDYQINARFLNTKTNAVEYVSYTISSNQA